MKMILRKIILYLSITLFVAKVDAQNVINYYNLYTSTPLLYNAAYFVPKEKLVGFANYHTQWLNLEGSPVYQTIGLSYRKYKNMGMGFTISNYSAGMINNTSVLAGYGYKIDITDSTQYIRMGLSMGITNDVLNTGSAENVDLNDYILNNNSYNKILFTSNFGILYHFQNIEASISLPRLYDHNRLFNQVFSLISYSYNFNKYLEIKPSIMYTNIRDFQDIADINLKGVWNRKLWVQIGYRSNNSFLLSTGVRFNNYNIAYAYEYNNSMLSNVNYGSHEIQFLYSIGKINRKRKIYLNIYVKDKTNNKPIHAKVVLEESNVPVLELNTDDKGFINAKVKQGKRFNILVESEGYLPANDEVFISPDSLNIVRDYKLMPQTIKVVGQVKDVKTKKPVDNVEIKILEGNKIEQTVTSNDKGQFEVTLKRFSEYRLNINKKNYKPKQIDISTNTETNRKEITVEILPYITIKGKIVEKKTNRPVGGVKIKVFDKKTNKQITSIMSDDRGAFYLEMQEPKDITLKISKKGYMFLDYDIQVSKSSASIEKLIPIEKIQKGVKVVLENVVFDEGKSELKASSLPEIDQIIEIMKNNPDIKIELSGHTDNVGSYSANKKISKDRAQAVANYMISKGISPDRLVVVGYGPDKPRASNDTEEGRERNRRVEAKIIN